MSEQITWITKRLLKKPERLKRWLKRQASRQRRREARLLVEDAPPRVTKFWAD